MFCHCVELSVTRLDFCENVIGVLERLRTDVLRTVGNSMFMNRRKGKGMYPEELRVIPDDRLQS